MGRYRYLTGLVTVGVAILIIFSSIAVDGWWRFRNDNSNSGYSQSINPPNDQFQKIWTSDYGSRGFIPSSAYIPNLSPVVSVTHMLVYHVYDRLQIVPSNPGDLVFAIDITSQTRTWEYQLPDGYNIASPIVLFNPSDPDTTLIVIASDMSKISTKVITFLDPSDGIKMGEFEFSGDEYLPLSPIIVDKHLFIYDQMLSINPDREGRIYKIALTGQNKYDSVYPEGYLTVNNLYKATFASWVSYNDYLILPLDDVRGKLMLFVMDDTDNPTTYLRQILEYDNDDYPFSCALDDTKENLIISTTRYLFSVKWQDIFNPEIDIRWEQITIPGYPIGTLAIDRSTNNIYIITDLKRPHPGESSSWRLFNFYICKISPNVEGYDIETLFLEKETAYYDGIIVDMENIYFCNDDGLCKINHLTFNSIVQYNTEKVCHSLPCVSLKFNIATILVFDFGYNLYAYT